MKKSTLKSLHSALKGMLKDEEGKKLNQEDFGAKGASETVPLVNSTKMQVLPKEGAFQTVEDQEHERKHNGIIYVMSRELHPIPKLTDEQIMARHKKADESMKQVWSNIIAKYESLDCQGDVIDLQTGEILEDNGHLRNISSENHNHREVTQYKSILQDILVTNECPEDSSSQSIWQDGETDDEEDNADYVQEMSEGESTDNDK